jgi:hypothetical protein
MHELFPGGDGAGTSRRMPMRIAGSVDVKRAVAGARARSTPDSPPR